MCSVTYMSETFEHSAVGLGSGRLNADITRELSSHLSEEEQEKLADKKELLFRQLAKEKLQPTRGLDKILEYIKQNRSKLKIGLATNAPRLVVDFELGILKLDEKVFFEVAKQETLEQYGTWRTVQNFEEINLDEIWSAIQSE
ncbi:hypothetical protein I4U23_017852 [Adineta vaga]|nr:hypothetical protein I4U23_017852 [Adineta vaga]